MKILRKLISTALIIAAVGCLIAAGILLFHYMAEDKQANSQLDALRPTAADTQLSDISAGTSSPEMTPEKNTDNSTVSMESSMESSPEDLTPTTETVSLIPNPYAESFLANEDMAGWLVIPGTNVDYPIMWTPGDENYYLYRDFEENNNANGSLILDTDSSLKPLTTNLIIHGHNMKSGAMFGNLMDYEDEDYYKEHSQILLYTEECLRNYEIIAVFRSQVYKKTDDVFKFYKFFEANTEEEFYDFYDNIKELSLYDTGVTAEYGDHFITLSTCAYHVENGRFVVVAKEIEPGDYYLPIE